MDPILDFVNDDASVLISDMSRCRPAEALSDRRRNDRWHLIPYTAEAFDGKILGAGTLADVPDVTLPLNASGWHAVLVGIWNPHYAYDGAFRIKLKLEGDEAFQPISEPEPPLEWPGRVEFVEVFFTYADLSGRDLVIRKQSKGRPAHAYVGYARLVPLAVDEVRRIEQHRAATDTRMMYALNDGNGLFYLGPTTREDLLEEVEQYRHSDVRTLVYAASSGDVVGHPSKVAKPWLADAGDGVCSPGHKLLRDSVHGLLDNGIVALEVLGEHVRAMGVEFHVMFRMAIVGDVAPSDLWHAESGLVRKHPEWRMVDIDGTPVEKASYAYPEVRAYMLSLIREVIEDYEVDGVNLGFIRGPHFSAYESISVQDFEKEHGIDPRTIDENDVRAQRHRAGYVTALIREARALTEEVSRKKRRRIELSATAYRGEAAFNLFFDLDLLAWTGEGLVDRLFLTEPFDPDFLDACRDANCRVVMAVGAGADPMEAMSTIATTALRGHDLPADGFWYWDMNGCQTQPAHWHALRQIGDRARMQEIVESPPVRRTTPLKTVEGLDVCHTTNHGADERGYWPPEMLVCYSGG
ncbi:MAG: hypothetical protein CMJ18_17700 [Phycisphaeraceae bacterium]|nr:hypothetical protein [Phycisphaeraceae bacterium]